MSRLKISLLLILTSFYCSGKSQELIDGVNAYRFENTTDYESIEFIKVGTSKEKKPVLLFCQGSLPIPLIIQLSDGTKMITGLSNFNYNKLSQKFHLIMLSPPFIPLEANEMQLNEQFAYITDKNDKFSYPNEYTENNYLGYYVKRLNDVIDFLIQQDWVDRNAIMAIGHSQGARVATQLASENKNIKALAVLSCDLTGRMTQPIWMAQIAYMNGQISSEEKEGRLSKVYNYYKSAQRNIDQPSKKGEDNNKNIVSFSKSLVETVTRLSIPVFIGYGTKDPASWYCDFIPINFIENTKENYLVKPYYGLDHNFFEKDPDGNTIYDKCHWDTVITECINYMTDNNME